MVQGGRSPKIKAGDFHKLLEIGARYGLVLENIRLPQGEDETEPGLDVRVGERGMRSPQLGKRNLVWLMKVVRRPLPLWILHLAGSK